MNLPLLYVTCSVFMMSTGAYQPCQVDKGKKMSWKIVKQRLVATLYLLENLVSVHHIIFLRVLLFFSIK